MRDSAPHAEVHAVAGNTDQGLELPDRLSLTLAGCAVALVHNSGPASGRAARLQRCFPDADLVVFGHSHLPWHEINTRPSDNHTQHHVGDPASPRPDLHRRARAPPRGAVAHVQHIPVI